MKQNSSIYIFSIFPVFNKDSVPNFESFDKEHSSYLHSTLLLNQKELADKLSETSSIHFCFDKNDEGFINYNFSGTDDITFLDFSDTTVLRNLSEKYFHKFTNNIIIFSNSIGITSEDLAKTFNLLCMEDEAVVLGKSINQSLSFIGFNSFNSNIFEDLELLNLNYDSFLNRISKFEHFVHVLDNFMLIKNIDDFKYLYLQLSKKESFAYCSQEIHERFTNLFIEYKDLLR
jgi:hypothetical protein